MQTLLPLCCLNAAINGCWSARALFGACVEFVFEPAEAMSGAVGSLCMVCHIYEFHCPSTDAYTAWGSSARTVLLKFLIDLDHHLPSSDALPRLVMVLAPATALQYRGCQ